MKNSIILKGGGGYWRIMRLDINILSHIESIYYQLGQEEKQQNLTLAESNNF